MKLRGEFFGSARSRATKIHTSMDGVNFRKTRKSRIKCFLCCIVAALIRDADKKVFSILGNPRVHHSKPVKAWPAERTVKIVVFYLRSYNPELNPDERLNADLKYAMGSKVPARTKPKLKAFTTSEHMEMLGKSPARVMSYFQDPRVRNAA